MFNSLITSQHEGKAVGRQKARHVIKSSFRSQMRKVTSSPNSAVNSQIRKENEQFHPDRNERVLPMKSIIFTQKKGQAIDADISFERGPRKFLSDYEKWMVKRTFEKEGRKTITVMDIRNEVANNEAFKTMFNSIVNSSYNGSIVGRHKAEQGIKNSFRYQFRAFDVGESKISSMDTNVIETATSKDVIYTDTDIGIDEDIRYSASKSDEHRTPYSVSRSSGLPCHSTAPNIITCDVEILKNGNVISNDASTLIETNINHRMK